MLGMTVLGAYVTLQGLGRAAGSTRRERRAILPGDGIVERAAFVTDHATTVEAPPEAVWPWLVQMGHGRAGWYTARWVDRLLFPANGPSADAIVPELQGLAVGDFVPDGEPETGCGFTVEVLVPERHLVLHSRTHLPPGWQERFGASIDWSWTFSLTPVAGDPARTRFHFRSRARLAPGWIAVGYWLVLIPADFVMARQMLRGVRRRAEDHRVDHPERGRRP